MATDLTITKGSPFVVSFSFRRDYVGTEDITYYAAVIKIRESLTSDSALFTWTDTSAQISRPTPDIVVLTLSATDTDNMTPFSSAVMNIWLYDPVDIVGYLSADYGIDYITGV